MILFFDDAAELTLQATAGIHEAAAVLAHEGWHVRVVDLFCSLSEAELAKLAAGATLVIIHSNGARPGEVYQQLVKLHKFLPADSLRVVAGWCGGLLSAIAIDDWLPYVNGLYSDGPRVTSFLKGILSGALCLNGSRRIWGGDAMPGVTPASHSCLATGYPWKVRTVTWEAPLCDSVCRKCTYGRCLREAYSADSAQVLAPRLAQIAAAGAQYVRLDDQTTPHTPQKLQSLAQLTRGLPPLSWLLRLDGAELMRTPAILDAIGLLPVAGLAVTLPSVSPAALHELSLSGDLTQLVMAIRARVGDDALVSVTGYIGYASDSASTVETALTRVQRWFDAGLVDTVAFEQAFLGKTSPVMFSGKYRFPVPGRLTGQFQPYWESDVSNSDEIAKLCESGNRHWQRKGVLHAQCRSLEQQAQLFELGIAPGTARKALRGSAEHQARHAAQIADARAAFICRYREQL